MKNSGGAAAQAQNKVPQKDTNFLLRLLQGAIIGLGAVLPGVSGGVLCVVFGVYKPVMELLSHPFTAAKKHARRLLPIVIGIGMGFLGISKLLGFLLGKYPDPSVCFFAGLIFGMLPSLFREAGAKGRSMASYLSAEVAFVLVMGLLLGLKAVSVTLEPNWAAYLFCGFCVALSVIVPGMSFSTLLMPLGLYKPLVDGIGNLDLPVIAFTGIGAVLTVVLLARAVTNVMERYYSITLHAILGVVVAATIYIIPLKSFISSISSGVINGACIVAGFVIALLLEKLNSRVEKPDDIA